VLKNLDKTLKISILIDYFRNFLSMTFKVIVSVKYLIYNILDNISFDKLSKNRKDFVANVLIQILSIKDYLRE
jgi:hypothetical protein